MKLKALGEEAKNKWGVRLSRFQLSRARVKAQKMIEGATLEQYKHLRSYGEELRRSNPGSTVVIKTMAGAGVPVFERIYVCLAACKRAFATTCRPLIGLDGCFLKGVYGGQLLTAVGKDGNNQMYPIAYAVVEAETKDSWDWFLDLLLFDLNSIQNKRWCFIFDQQKGLVPTLAVMDENVDHRFCVKHLYANFRKKYLGDEMKGALWNAARACTVPWWEKVMLKIKELNEDAWNDLKQVPMKQCSRARYSTYPVCDLQVNNMCKAFNRAILEYRDKPIINLLEGLKFYLINRIVKQRYVDLRYQGELCPTIQKKLEVSKRDVVAWLPVNVGDQNNALFEVTNGTWKYVVNLAAKTCRAEGGT
ncbi:uncharacterized protein LOC130728074 [Lotus japonicus]|uniref:uncharacterized protein LOC130728074 n=1 Tax=Lotus japonicus TaxID=34305 RepID=UPI002587704E|nr:uncharacterized protein LOC130728074 [Lotus japonicus]